MGGAMGAVGGAGRAESAVRLARCRQVAGGQGAWCRQSRRRARPASAHPGQPPDQADPAGALLLQLLLQGGAHLGGGGANESALTPRSAAPHPTQLLRAAAAPPPAPHSPIIWGAAAPFATHAPTPHAQCPLNKARQTTNPALALPPPPTLSSCRNLERVGAAVMALTTDVPAGTLTAAQRRPGERVDRGEGRGPHAAKYHPERCYQAQHTHPRRPCSWH